MKISIIVIAWNNRTELKECLNSLRSQTIKGFETILIDNCSSDGTPEMVREEYPSVVIGVMEYNLGFAEGCNRGIELAKGEWICTLNSDTVVDPDWVERICTAIHDAKDDTGMFQSKVLFKRSPDRINSTGIELLATGGTGDRDFNAPDTREDKQQEIFVPSACAAVYRRKMLQEAKLETGIFDRSFFMYAEDLDVGWRCRLMGWKAYYLPSARVIHSYRSSSDKWGNKWAELQCRKNRVRALTKNGSMTFLVATFPKTIYDLLIGFRYSGFKVLVEFFRALRDGLSQRKKVSQLLTVPRREIEKTWVTKAIRIKRHNRL